MVTCPGLTCARCLLPFDRKLARRTHIGYVHARPCHSPSVLVAGRWVYKGGVGRWVAAEKDAENPVWTGGSAPERWENGASPRRCVNTVAPGALTDRTLEGVIG